MEYPTLTDAQKQSIADVIEGKTEEFEDVNIAPNAIITHMDSLGYTYEDIEVNGWQYDWWLHFSKGEASWTASGSGYYGNFEFTPTED